MATRKSAAQEGFEILEGLDGIRRAPNMYLGEQGHPMALRAVAEIVDNSYDEWVAGRNKWIEVIINYDQDLIVVADMAGGIPTELKRLKDGSAVSILTAAYGMTHAGGKFNDQAYKTSSGTHGIGVSAVNAISSWLQVWSNYKGQTVTQRWTIGHPDHERPKAAKIDPKIQKLLKYPGRKYGTITAFELDQTVVSENAVRGKKLPSNYVKAQVQPRELAEMLRNIAYLNPGLQIHVKLVRKNKVQQKTYVNTKGLAWVPQFFAEQRELETQGRPFVYQDDYITCALIWTNNPETDGFLSFVNTKRSVDGGWHVTGFQAALAQAIKPYVKTKAKFHNSDLFIGLVGVFDWRMHGARFTSQVKDKLASRVDGEVSKILTPVFEQFFKKNGAVARAIVRRAQAMAKGRAELAAVVRTMTDVKKVARGNTLPAKLATAPHCKPEDRELFIVEGDSAKGTGCDARDSSYQEVLGVDGKPLNALTAPLARVLGNERIQGMLLALGADIKSLDPKDEHPRLSADNLRVGNVIFLVDPDPDGGHIATLFLAAIYRLIPDLLRQGRVWSVKAPLFAVLHKGVVYGGMTMDECLAVAPPGTKPSNVTRIKGWGEVDDRWLAPIAFDPKHRHLVAINPFKSAEDEQLFRGIVAEDAMYRRQLLGLEE